LDSKRLVGGFERSVMSRFELGRGHVAEVAVKAFGVVPVHPAQNGTYVAPIAELLCQQTSQGLVIRVVVGATRRVASACIPAVTC